MSDPTLAAEVLCEPNERVLQEGQSEQMEKGKPEPSSSPSAVESALLAATVATAVASTLSIPSAEKKEGEGEEANEAGEMERIPTIASESGSTSVCTDICAHEDTEKQMKGDGAEDSSKSSSSSSSNSNNNNRNYNKNNLENCDVEHNKEDEEVEDNEEDDDDEDDEGKVPQPKKRRQKQKALVGNEESKPLSPSSASAILVQSKTTELLLSTRSSSKLSLDTEGLNSSPSTSLTSMPTVAHVSSLYSQQQIGSSGRSSPSSIASSTLSSTPPSSALSSSASFQSSLAMIPVLRKPNADTVRIEGYLAQKILIEKGRKSKDRSWKTYFYVLRGNKLYSYKDHYYRIDAKANTRSSPNGFISALEELDISQSVAEIAYAYRKREHVFSLSTHEGLHCLLQANNQKDMLSWISEVHQVVQSEGQDTSLLSSIMNKKAFVERGSSLQRSATISSPIQMDTHRNQHKSLQAQASFDSVLSTTSSNSILDGSSEISNAPSLRKSVGRSMSETEAEHSSAEPGKQQKIQALRERLLSLSLALKTKEQELAGLEEQEVNREDFKRRASRIVLQSIRLELDSDEDSEPKKKASNSSTTSTKENAEDAISSNDAIDEEQSVSKEVVAELKDCEDDDEDYDDRNSIHSAEGAEVEKNDTISVAEASINESDISIATNVSQVSNADHEDGLDKTGDKNKLPPQHTSPPRSKADIDKFVADAGMNRCNMQAAAVENFVAEEELELSFGKHDILHIVGTSEDGWWLAMSGKQLGLVPSEFLTMMSEYSDENDRNSGNEKTEEDVVSFVVVEHSDAIGHEETKTNEAELLLENPSIDEATAAVSEATAVPTETQICAELTAVGEMTSDLLLSSPSVVISKEEMDNFRMQMEQKMAALKAQHEQELSNMYAKELSMEAALGEAVQAVKDLHHKNDQRIVQLEELLQSATQKVENEKCKVSALETELRCAKSQYEEELEKATQAKKADNDGVQKEEELEKLKEAVSSLTEKLAASEKSLLLANDTISQLERNMELSLEKKSQVELRAQMDENVSLKTENQQLQASVAALSLEVSKINESLSSSEARFAAADKLASQLLTRAELAEKNIQVSEKLHKSTVQSMQNELSNLKRRVAELELQESRHISQKPSVAPDAGAVSGKAAAMEIKAAGGAGALESPEERLARLEKEREILEKVDEEQRLKRKEAEENENKRRMLQSAAATQAVKAKNETASSAPEQSSSAPIASKAGAASPVSAAAGDTLPSRKNSKRVLANAAGNSIKVTPQSSSNGIADPNASQSSSTPFDHRLITKYYTYQELLSKPSGVDIFHLEMYLSNEEFSQLFDTTKENFLKQPKWKQRQHKTQLGLF